MERPTKTAVSIMDMMRPVSPAPPAMLFVFASMKDAERAGFRGEIQWRHLERPDSQAYWPAMGDPDYLLGGRLWTHIIITQDLRDQSAWEYDRNRETLARLHRRKSPDTAWIDLR